MPKLNVKNFGFIPPYINPDQWVLGVNSSLPFEILVPDGNWKKWQTEGEIQRNDFFDSFNCTGYGTAKSIRTYMLAKFGIDYNPSERWIGIIAGTKPPGNNPHVVLEAIRKQGLIPEAILPFDSSITTIEEYYSFKGSHIEICRAEARAWLELYDFGHEWLFYPTSDVNYKKAQLKKYLVSCMPCISVDAWKERNGKYFKEVGAIDNHWTTIQAEQWIVKDSYPEFEKLLEEDYDFGFAKRIYIGLRKYIPKKKCWLFSLLPSLKPKSAVMTSDGFGKKRFEANFQKVKIF